MMPFLDLFKSKYKEWTCDHSDRYLEEEGFSFRSIFKRVDRRGDWYYIHCEMDVYRCLDCGTIQTENKSRRREYVSDQEDTTGISNT